MLVHIALITGVVAEAAPGRQNVNAQAQQVAPISIVVPIRDAGLPTTVFGYDAGGPMPLGDAAQGRPVVLLFDNQSSRDVTIRVDRARLLQVPIGDRRSLDLMYSARGDTAPRTIEVLFDGVPVQTGYFTLMPPPGVTALVPAPPPPPPPVGQTKTVGQSRDPGIEYQSDSATPFKIPVRLNGTGIDDWNFRNPRNPPYLLKISPQNSSAAKTLGEALKLRAGQDPTDIVTNTVKVIESSLKHAIEEYNRAVANARPGEVPTPPQDPWQTMALLEKTVLEFSNYGIDRTLTVTFNIPEPPELAAAGMDPAARIKAQEQFERSEQVKLGECGTSPPIKCKLVINVPFGSPKTFRVLLLVPRKIIDPNRAFLDWWTYLSAAQQPITFTVNFFDENATPAESTGYVSLVPLPQLKEPDSKTNWTLSPTISAARDPLVNDTTVLSPENPFPGDVRRTLLGTARLRLQQTLGGRADAVVDFVFKSGVLGEKDQSGKVSVPTYQVNINSIPGLRLSFGRFLFANPAQGIASNDAGEGFRIGFRNKVGVSHIVRRESVDGAPDTTNSDNKLLLFEVNNIAGQRWQVVRGINFLATLGQDRAPKTRHWYGTAGFDTSFSVPESPFGGTFAYYYSERRPRGTELEPLIVRGSGHVALGTLTYTLFGEPSPKSLVSRKPLMSVRMELGRGRGDDQDTADRDESYLGESASFNPDVMFLSTFVGRLQGVGPRNKNLSNKTYLALVYQDERFTPLDLVAKVLLIPSRDVASRLLRAGLRAYHFSTDLTPGSEAHDAGHELFAESMIETPAGVRSSLVIACYQPGKAVQAYFKDDALWSIVAKVTIALGN